MHAGKKNLIEKKFLFLDIDGVITPTLEFIPEVPPTITKDSIRILKKFVEKKFKLVFITARCSIEIRTKGGLEEILKKKQSAQKFYYLCLKRT